MQCRLFDNFIQFLYVSYLTVNFLSRHQLLIIIGVINNLVVIANFRIIWGYVYQTLSQELRIFARQIRLRSHINITYLQASVKKKMQMVPTIIITIIKHTLRSEVWCLFPIIAIMIIGLLMMIIIIINNKTKACNHIYSNYI